MEIKFSCPLEITTELFEFLVPFFAVEGAAVGLLTLLGCFLANLNLKVIKEEF